VNTAPFDQNIIAMVWDFDKTLISGYMQEPLFRRYGIEGKAFWNEVNRLGAFYAKRGIQVNRDTSYMNNNQTKVNKGPMNGLSNRM
jgi:hypothetical protein